MAAEKKNVRSERFVSNIDDFEIKKASKSVEEKEDKKNDKEKRAESFDEYVNKSK